MKRPVLEIQGFLGLNNKDSTLRLIDNKYTELTDCQNVIVTDRGTIKNCPSVTQVSSTSADHLLSVGDFLFYAKDEKLYLFPDILLYEFDYIIPALYGASDGTRIFISTTIHNGSYYQETFSIFPDYEDKIKKALPAGILRYMNGILYSATGSTVYISEPFEPTVYDKRDGFVTYPTPITSFESAFKFLLVSDKQHTYILQPTDEGYINRIVYDRPALADSMVKSVLFKGKEYFNAVLFATVDGVFAVLESGELIPVDISYSFEGDKFEGYTLDMTNAHLYVGRLV